MRLMRRDRRGRIGAAGVGAAGVGAAGVGAAGVCVGTGERAVVAFGVCA